MWAPLAAVLAKNHTVIVPDLRGMGLSAHPDTGYTRSVRPSTSWRAGRAQGRAGRARHARHRQHGGLCLAAQYPERITRWVVIDAPLPGIGHWDEHRAEPAALALQFPGAGRGTPGAGRERIYLDRFYNELSADPKRIDEATREHYAALYARPHAMHDAFEQLPAFSQDAVDNKALLTAAASCPCRCSPSEARSPSAPGWRR